MQYEAMAPEAWDSITGVLTCSKCGGVFPATREFWFTRQSRPRGFYSRCKACSSTAKPLPIERACNECGQVFPRTPEYWHKLNGKGDGLQYRCKTCSNAHRRESEYAKSQHKKRMRVYHQQVGKPKLLQLRMECLIAYSQDPPYCACCGEDTYEFLELHHLNGGGGKSRKQHGSGQLELKKLKELGYPPGFAVNCANCHSAITYHGGCPHQSG